MELQRPWSGLFHHPPPLLSSLPPSENIELFNLKKSSITGATVQQCEDGWI